MNVEKMTVVIRLRQAWEAIDLGVSMARQWFVPMLLIWLMLAVPVGVVLMLLPIPLGYAMLIFWWLKPLYEKPVMHFLSRALFGEFDEIRSYPKQLWRIIKPNLLKEISLWRPSFSRSFTMPVSMLEGLIGSDRTSRISVLQQGNQGAIQWTTIVLLHVEMFFYFSLLVTLYFFIPEQWLPDISLSSLLMMESSWLTYVSNACYVIAVAMVAPFFVACGFALYIMRRTELEGWDIELQFKQLASQYQPQDNQHHQSTSHVVSMRQMQSQAQSGHEGESEVS